ncbi:MAG: hypothetical protein KF902_13980 [Phycisphaeraceae bacterium]|nr:hypothetical protein [Phycisphaeraceae bacterium]
MARPTRPLVNSTLALIGAASISLSVHAQGTPETPAAEPPTPAAAPHKWMPGQPITTADDLLVALETADLEIKTFKAGIRYTRIFSLAGDEQIRDGTLYYETLDRGDATTPASRRFAVHFTQLRVGKRVEKEPKDYIFDGEWLVERLEKDKQFIKRQVVPPGERFDPLRIGEGPFPVPVGQRRDDVLKRYRVTMLAPDDGVDADSLRSFINSGDGSYQLLLVPIADPQDADELAEIRVWYRKSDLLPRMARTINLVGDESIIQMLNPEKNPKDLPYRIFDTATPARGWNVRIEPYRGRIDPP